MIVCNGVSKMMIAGVYDFTNWKENFIEYIELNGNKPSVARDYAKRIEKILEEESITIQTLSSDIDQWIEEYKKGKYVSINKARHYAPSSALIKFKAFIPTLCKPHIPEKTDLMDVLTGRHRTDILY